MSESNSCHHEKDGTLVVTVPKGTNVGRVLVQEEGTCIGRLFYPDHFAGFSKMNTISRKAAIHVIDGYDFDYPQYMERFVAELRDAMKKDLIADVKALPSAQPEQRYTEEELRVFAHGISLSLLSKRSAQHWRYDKDTATEIEFLERLYDKVVADMRGERDG